MKSYNDEILICWDNFHHNLIIREIDKLCFVFKICRIFHNYYVTLETFKNALIQIRPWNCTSVIIRIVVALLLIMIIYKSI